MIASWTNMKNTGCSLQGKRHKGKRMQYGVWRLEIKHQQGHKRTVGQAPSGPRTQFTPNKALSAGWGRLRCSAEQALTSAHCPHTELHASTQHTAIQLIIWAAFPQLSLWCQRRLLGTSPHFHFFFDSKELEVPAKSSAF